MTLFRISPAAFALLFLLAACGQQESSAKKDESDDAPPIPVETSKPARGDIYAVYAGTAPIEAFAEADVIAKVDGEVREIFFEEGQDVSAGDVLARLDGERLQLELNESEARLRKLERDYERNVDLSEKDLVSAGDFEKIKFEMEAQRAAHNLRSLELDYTQIRAPIDGVISERYIKVGNTLSEGDPVFRVTSLDPLVAYLHVPEREYRNLGVGQPVGIDIDALSGPPVIAAVSRISPTIDPATGTFKITIEIRDPERRIKPGMFGRIGVVYDRHANALQVPRSALVEELGRTSVFVVEDGKAVRKFVETGFSEGGMVEIVTGLGDAEDVVTVGQIGLKDDAVVTVINADTDDDAETDDDAPVSLAERNGEEDDASID
ncbi:MAG: efflux RND transporter periplasmic adaptor subunit [Woeseiaceae bacterium]|nr:efflux RND transporter periplasmic adaptor subunit [Woeseiaceae bacterium]